MKMSEGETRELKMSAHDLDVMLAWGFSVLGTTPRAQVETRQGEAYLRASSPLPRVNRFLNLNLGLWGGVERGNLELRITELNVGQIRSPLWLLTPVSTLAGTVVKSDRTLKPILEGIDLSVQPGEFAVIFGTSGSGKSTLIDALNGRRPASGGNVLYNGSDLYASFGLFRSTIGYVPQQDIVHRRISVRRALTYAGRLRLPEDTSDAEIEEHVMRVLDHVGLSEKIDQPIENRVVAEACRRVEQIVSDLRLVELTNRANDLLLARFGSIPADEQQRRPYFISLRESLSDRRLASLAIVVLQSANDLTSVITNAFRKKGTLQEVGRSLERLVQNLQ